MFKKKKKIEQNENYQRVYRLHEQAEFLCYINESYLESYKGNEYRKLEGIVAKGTGQVGECYELYDCNGRKKATVSMEEFYVGQNLVEQLAGGDKHVALYPREQDVNYVAGDILCKIKNQEDVECQ